MRSQQTRALTLVLKMCVPMNVSAPELRAAWEKNAKLVKQLKTTPMTAAKKSTGMLEYDA